MNKFFSREQVDISLAIIGRACVALEALTGMSWAFAGLDYDFKRAIGIETLISLDDKRDGRIFIPFEEVLRWSETDDISRMKRIADDEAAQWVPDQKPSQ